jgi:hypothetical protein
MGLEVGGLGTDPETRVAFEHEIDLVGDGVLAPFHLLLRLETNEVGNETGPV